MFTCSPGCSRSRVFPWQWANSQNVQFTYVFLTFVINFWPHYLKNIVEIVLLCTLPLVVVRDLFKPIAVVRTALGYALSLPFREPSRVGIIAISLEIVPHGTICVIAKTSLKYEITHFTSHFCRLEYMVVGSSLEYELEGRDQHFLDPSTQA